MASYYFEDMEDLKDFLKKIGLSDGDIDRITWLCRNYARDEFPVHLVDEDEEVTVISDSCDGSLVSISEDYESNTMPTRCYRVRSSCWDGHSATECTFRLRPGEWVVAFATGWQGDETIRECDIIVNPPKRP